MAFRLLSMLVHSVWQCTQPQIGSQRRVLGFCLDTASEQFCGLFKHDAVCMHSVWGTKLTDCKYCLVSALAPVYVDTQEHEIRGKHSTWQQ